METDFLLHPETKSDWSSQAICGGLTHVFFGPPAERPERRNERERTAQTYCQTCPAIKACRNNARINREHGVWGGETDEMRAAAGYPPRSPSRRSVIQARDSALHLGQTEKAYAAEAS